MKTKKRNKFFIVSLISALLLLGGIFLGFSPASKTAYADTPLSAFKFTQVSSAGYSVAALDKTMTYAEIPPEYNGLPVIEVAANGFASCLNLETVKIPGSVKKIGTGAFMNCAKLKDIPMVATETIGQNAFALCKKIDTLVLPRTIQTIGANILLNAGTENMTIYSRVPKAIADTWSGWLNSCSATVIYGDDLNCDPIYDDNDVLIGYSVGYQGLVNNTEDLYIDTHMGLPILEIQEIAFFWSALKSVHVGFNSTHSINIKSYAFNEAAIPTIMLDDNVTFIDEYSYDEEKGYEGISNSVFLSSKVEQVVLPNTLDSILPMMFQECKELESMSFINELTTNILPSHITSVHALAFAGCSLPSISMPKSVEKMGVAVFDGWSLERKLPTGIDIAFTEYEVDELIELWEETNGEEGWNPYWNSGCNKYIVEFWSTPGLSYTALSATSYKVSVGTATTASDIIVSSVHNRRDVFEIAANAFSNRTNILNVKLPKSLNSIGVSAFSGCSNLTSMILPFAGNTPTGTSNTNFGYIFGTTDINSQQNFVPASLKTVTIKGASSIPSNSFWNCLNLKNITISKSVQTIGISAFGQCTSLTNLTIPFVGARADMTTFTYFGYVIGGPASVAPASLKTVTITGGNKIPAQAFSSGCQNIETIIIPKSVKTIVYGAFQNCRSLSNIVIPEGVEYIDNGAFAYCESLKSITIPESVTGMHDEVFWGCNNLETIIFKRPASMGVTDINWATFCYPNTCTKLTLIAVPDSASQAAYRNLFPSGSFYTPTVNLIRYVPGFIV